MRYYDRMEKKVTDAMLFRFFAEQTTLEETDMISAWLNEDPEKNQKVLDKAYNLYVLGIMCAPNPEAGINNSCVSDGRKCCVMPELLPPFYCSELLSTMCF